MENPQWHTSGRTLLRLTIAWAIGLLLYFTFYLKLEETLWILVSIIGLALVVSGASLGIASMIIIKRSRYLALLVISIISLGLTAFFTVGFSTGEHVRFVLLKSYYEREMRRIVAETHKVESIHRSDCQIDLGPPIRVAFYWYRGVTDNWIGLVYDPTGAVMNANNFKPDWPNWQDTDLLPIKKLFGGDMMGAKKMANSWYLCWFT